MSQLIKMNMGKIFFLLIFLAGLKISYGQNDTTGNGALTGFLEDNYLPPEEFILKKFQSHQIIFLGENHWVKHDVEFVRDIIPILYKNGINFLALEFANKNDQCLIDSLITSENYNRELAEKILFNEFVFWGFKEYADIFKSAWKLNKEIAGSNIKFRILGINCISDWSIIKTPEDLKNVETRRRIWKGCGEKDWGQVILDEIVDKNEKGLVYCGAHHAFTEYLLPIYNVEKDTLYRFEDDRAGRYVYNKIGKECITILLHSPWRADGKTGDKYVQPVDGKIEQIMEKLPEKFRRIGFDTKDSPFGKLKSSNSFYKYGYPNFCLSDFCDGYIYLGPINEFEGVTVIKDFINEKNIKDAREQSPDLDFRNANIPDFIEAMNEMANVKEKYKDIK